MVTKTNMNQVFENLNNLKNAFKIGEKVVPIIQNLSEFMQEIVPLLENINFSIHESTSQMPKATNQINDVTSATELATTEILDLVDQISNKVTEIEGTLNSVKNTNNEKLEIIKQLTELVKDNKEASELCEKLVNCEETNSILDEVNSKLVLINDDTFKITMSLQVQDITTQQLSAVNHLIENVNDKLQTLMSQIDNSDLKEEFQNFQIEVPEDATYDPNARYDHDQSKQQNVDTIINEQKEQASQDEIDKLFA